MKFLELMIALAAACFARGFWETTAQERLEIRYAIDGGSLESLPVNFDVRDLAFREARITSLILPEGLTRLESLSVANNQLTNLT